MPDRFSPFFAGLGRSGPDRLTIAATGVIRFDFLGAHKTVSWYVRLTHGAVQTEQTEQHADCVVEVPPDAFERLIKGGDHLVSMLLRGAISVQGDLSLLMVFRRLLPVSADSAGPDPNSTMSRWPVRRGPISSNANRIFHGSTFLLCEPSGDLAADSTTPLGLYFFDTRFLSTWRLTVQGEPLSVLSVDEIRPFESRLALVPGVPKHYVSATTSVIRHRWLGDAFEERVTLFNHAPEPVHFTVRLDIAADFAEILEVKDGFQRPRRITTKVDGERLRLRYQRESLINETVISASEQGAIDECGMTFVVTIDSHGTWTVQFAVLTLIRDLRELELRERLSSYTDKPVSEVGQEAEEVTSVVPTLRGDYAPLCEAYQRSIHDLAALRFRGLNYYERLPATGIPWSMALLGRESIISSLQTLPFLPERAVSTLRILALAQGSRIDPFRGEEPGKILQESRYAEAAAFNEVPDSADYSAADTTALFVILLDEYERWTGDADLVRAFEKVARAAIGWIDEYADLVGNGYVWSARRDTRTGSINQSWKGSANASCFRDGRLATFPQALAEIQGYTYDAKLRAARLARTFWADPAYADRLESDAAALRERFNREFWMPERGHHALALQADGTQVDALSSSIGQLLWSGIVEPSHARSIATHLVGPALYSGWGVRTLATTEALFSPLGYHTGAIWPADNSIIVWGLRRYGFRREAALIAHSMIEAGRYFGGRLPAVFAGYDRARTRYPVPHTFPDIPYAPSAGAPLLLLRALLGLEPYDDHLMIDAAVPEEMGQIELLDIPGRWGQVDALGRGRPFHADGGQGQRAG